MTDSNTPADPNTPPPAAPSYESAPPAAPQYSAAPPAPYGAPASAPVPGRTLGIVAFVLSFFIQLVALVLGIVALVQSRKAGQKNGFALAAIIISSILIVIGIIVAIVVVAVIVPAVTEEFLRLCSEYGNGVHEIDGTTVTLQGCPS